MRMLPIAALLLLLPAAAGATVPAWDYQPYRVQIVVVASDMPEMSAANQSRWRQQLCQRLGNLYAPLWDCTAIAAPEALRRSAANGLDRLTADAMQPLAAGKQPQEAPDKVLVLHVAWQPSGFALAVRDYDVRTALLSAPANRDRIEPGRLIDEAAGVLGDGFAPIARVESVQGENLVLRLRGSQLQPHEAPMAIAAGDAFRLIVRVTDPDGATRQAATVPWTICTITAADSEQCEGRLLSGLDRPLATARGPGVERLALRAVATDRPTELSLRSATEPSTPLVGFSVLGVDPERSTTTWLGLTDGSGRLSIARDDLAWRLLAISDGERSIAKLPLLVGAEDVVVAELPAATADIATAAFVAGLRDEVVDVLARRQILVARLAEHLEAKRWDKAETTLAAIRKLPAAHEVAAGLLQRRGRLPADDTSTQQRVDALLAEAQRALEKQIHAKLLDQWGDAIDRGRTPPPKEPTTDAPSPPSE